MTCLPWSCVNPIWYTSVSGLNTKILLPTECNECNQIRMSTSSALDVNVGLIIASFSLLVLYAFSPMVKNSWSRLCSGMKFGTMSRKSCAKYWVRFFLHGLHASSTFQCSGILLSLVNVVHSWWVSSFSLAKSRIFCSNNFGDSGNPPGLSNKTCTCSTPAVKCGWTYLTSNISAYSLIVSIVGTGGVIIMNMPSKMTDEGTHGSCVKMRGASSYLQMR